MPLSIEDQLDITELMARYNHAIDSSQAEAWADTFTDDAVFEGSAGAVSGREELLAFVRGRDQSNRIRHWNNNVLIDGDGDDATAKVYLVTFDVSGPADNPRVRRVPRHAQARGRAMEVHAPQGPQRRAACLTAAERRTDCGRDRKERRAALLR